MESHLILSTLPKTWLFDLDGTIVKHNGYKTDGFDSLLAGAAEYLAALPPEDKIIILTSRSEEFRDCTISFLNDHAVRYDEIFFCMPLGERIVVNDRKNSGLDMAFAFNLHRDRFRLPPVLRLR